MYNYIVDKDSGADVVVKHDCDERQGMAISQLFVTHSLLGVKEAQRLARTRLLHVQASQTVATKPTAEQLQQHLQQQVTCNRNISTKA